MNVSGMIHRGERSVQHTTVVRFPLSLVHFLFSLLLIFLVFGCSGAAAANYRFSIPQMKLVVNIQKDGSITMDYTITFANDPFADPIDVVDIGLPHSNYDFSNMTASINGIPLTDIRKSEYVAIGVEAHLGGNAIRPGQTGVFRFQCSMPDMVYQDTTHKEWASLQITPTWFGAQFLTGTTDLQLAVSVPEGVQPNELHYQKEPFWGKAVFQGRACAIWKWPSTRVDGPHEVGVSFPKHVMDRVISMTIFKLFLTWFEESRKAQVWSGMLLFLGFAICFFRFSGGTGCSLFVPLALVAGFTFAASPKLHLLSWLGLVPLLCLMEWATRNRKQKYLPALVSVEGGGIKRGLTAPEAAVLLEMPLNKVLTLVLFGLLKKGVITKTGDAPLRLEVCPEFLGNAETRRKAAAAKGIVLHGYEIPFIETLESESAKCVAEMSFTNAMQALIQSVATRMKGFDVEETREYYRHIIRRAWSEAETLGNVELRQQKVNQTLDWLLLDPDYDDRFHRWERGGYRYRPSWGGSTWGDVSVPSRTGGSRGGTSLGDVTSSFAGWAEGVMGNMAEAIEPVRLSTAKGGVIDLSGVDKVAANVLDALATSASSSSGRGGGGCACAGCACACACAGGGR